MKKYILYKLKNKNAQALPEFALCMPLILLIIGMIVSLGQMTYCKQVLQAAAEAGCRVYVDAQYKVENDIGILENILNNVSNRQAEEAAKETAIAIVDNAGFGIEIVGEPTAQPYDLPVNTSEVDGKQFKYIKYRVEGKFATLFPVSWEGKSLLDSDGYTHLYGCMIMLYERTF